MDNPKFIVSNQKEESISIERDKVPADDILKFSSGRHFQILQQTTFSNFVAAKA